MTIDEKRLVELCQQAAKEKNSKKAACIDQADRPLTGGRLWSMGAYQSGDKWVPSSSPIAQ